MERDNHANGRFCGYVNFNSHAHVERDSNWLNDLSQYVNFNSHAHVERDISYAIYARDDLISTHTLTWSVTFSFLKTSAE